MPNENPSEDINNNEVKLALILFVCRCSEKAQYYNRGININLLAIVEDIKLFDNYD